MRRRELLALAPVIGAGLFAQEGRKGSLEIAEIETFLVKVNRRGNWLLVRLKTRDGLTGIGDASHGGSDAKKIEHLKRFFALVKGRRAFDVEAYRKAAEAEVLRGGTAGAVAFSGIEQAMWDMAGKARSVPCYDLFGGLLSARIRNYANINRSTEVRDPAGFATRASEAVSAGFDAVKLAPWDDMPRDLSDAGKVESLTKLGLQRAAAVREAIGPKRDLLLDAHSHFDLRRGLELAKRVEPLKLFWLEEVVPANPPDGLAAINRAATMPTAGGEAILGVRGFYPYIAAKAVDIVMPDVKYCGGMLELKKIAAMAEAAGMPVAPHGPASPVGNMAAAQVCATLPNFQILEYSFGEVPWRAELVDPPESLSAGYMTVSNRPGLGIALNEKTVSRYRA
jgi:galactonate dehydratase